MEDPLYSIHELIFDHLDIESKKAYALTCRYMNWVFKRKTMNFKQVAEEAWEEVSVENEISTPYTITVMRKQYHFLAVYVEINGVPCALKLLDSHIFLSYIPAEDVSKIRTMITFGNFMDQFNDYYIHKLINIRYDKQYFKLGMFYIDMYREHFSFSIRKGGHEKITEKQIYGVLYQYWKRYYNRRLPIHRYLITGHNYYKEDGLHENVDVSLYVSPYNIREHEFIKLPEFVKR